MMPSSPHPLSKPVNTAITTASNPRITFSPIRQRQ
jgi:hypothetical protein